VFLDSADVVALLELLASCVGLVSLLVLRLLAPAVHHLLSDAIVHARDCQVDCPDSWCSCVELFAGVAGVGAVFVVVVAAVCFDVGVVGFLAAVAVACRLLLQLLPSLLDVCCCCCCCCYCCVAAVKVVVYVVATAGVLFVFWVLLPAVFRQSAVLMLHTTASSPTEPFAAFCSGTAAYKTAFLRSVRRHCARGLVAPLTRPALAVHFNCRQPRHDASEIDHLPIPLPPSPPPHSAASPAPCARVSPFPLAARLFRLVCALVFVPPRTPVVHSLARSVSYQLLRTPFGALTSSTCRRAPSASGTSGTRLGLCDGARAAQR
jgi:hypothetical protein